MISRELIVCAISFYEELINKMSELLRCFTPGIYYCRQNGMYPQYMLHTEDGRFLYIHKKNRAIAREQVLKKDLQERLADYIARRDFWQKVEVYRLERRKDALKVGNADRPDTESAGNSLSL